MIWGQATLHKILLSPSGDALHHETLRLHPHLGLHRPRERARRGRLREERGTASARYELNFNFMLNRNWDPEIHFDFITLGELEFSDQDDFSEGPHEIRVRPPPGFADDLSLIGSKVT